MNPLVIVSGVNADFSRSEIDAAAIVFDNPRKDEILRMALEIPFDTVMYCIEKSAMK